MAGRRSTGRRANTGNDGEGRDQAACNKRRALTGFRPAPPVVGNCRPLFPRRAFCVLHSSPSPPAVLTTAPASLSIHLSIPDEWNGQHTGISRNSSYHALRHLSPITPSTHDGSRHVPNTPSMYCQSTALRRSAGNASSLIVSEGRCGMYAQPIRLPSVGDHFGGVAPLFGDRARSVGRREGGLEYVASFLNLDIEVVYTYLREFGKPQGNPALTIHDRLFLNLHIPRHLRVQYRRQRHMDAAEDCMRALRAPPPNLPTFRWTGLGRGPPRSDPEIFNAGLEVWAALDAALGRSRSIKGLGIYSFCIASLLRPAVPPFFERASSIDTKRTNDFLRFSAIVLLAAVPPVPIGPSRRPPLSATVTFLLAVIVVSILLASTRTQKARRWKSVCSVTRHSRPLHCASSTRSAVLRDPSTPFGQKRGTTRSSTTSRHPHFDLTRAAQEYDGEPLTTHERSRHRRRAHRSRHHLSSFPHFHVDAAAGLDPRRHRPQRFRPPPPPTFRPGPFFGVIFTACDDPGGFFAPSLLGRKGALSGLGGEGGLRNVVRFRDARGTREFPPRRLMMEGGSLRREREKGGYSCAPMDFLGDPRRWMCARALSCKIYDGGRVFPRFLAKEEGGDALTRREAEPPEARVRFLGERCDGGGVSPTPFWGKGLVQALPTTGGGGEMSPLEVRTRTLGRGGDLHTQEGVAIFVEPPKAYARFLG
ncbi:uncharacterized protein SCHCODRAFT_02669146 [Schizophyllum commune H4-8]|uniref:uncharacterized protein n=1 Tax=Schizophyllum commune (strain H4-8 / FGSC 9210) TaxID=578458 RepID=UPI00215E3388|nr:uncharacterized protein SCHCODRAFT_02669146 [Schizophyllum commune H4-8]KAI5889866.1 hypothetical protein SCHCODRAFT_02669146 [Schizophyllum commune H4-8]